MTSLDKRFASSRRFDVFTDGACLGNPGPGGWGFVIRDLDVNGEDVEGSGAEPGTTNNRMELQSVIEALRILPQGSTIRLVTDSNYVAKGISEWMAGWKSRGWKRLEGGRLKPVKNEELWRELDELLARSTVKTEWVKGHAGHPENERCDQLAGAAIRAMLDG